MATYCYYEKVHKTVRTAIVSYLLNMNTALRKNGINGFEKDFLKLMNNGYFGKAIKNLTKHIDIKLLTTKTRRNYLVLEPNYHATKIYSYNLFAMQMKIS